MIIFIFIIILIILLLFLIKKFTSRNIIIKSQPYIKDVLNVKEKKRLNKLLQQTISYLNQRNIPYFMGFGSLIGATRHGHRMPWDDDIDLIINNDDINKLFKNLKLRAKNYNVQEYYLTDNLIITKKNFGVPIKIRYKSYNYPFVDINTYNYKNGIITIPPDQLLYGHVKKFKEDINDIFPLINAKFENINVKIPNKYEKILKNHYGNDVLSVCKITYNHANRKEPNCKQFNCIKGKNNDKVSKDFKLSELNKKYVNPIIWE